MSQSLYHNDRFRNRHHAHQALLREIVSSYGPVVGGDDLRRLLCYPTPGALRQAIHVGRVPVPVQRCQQRRGYQALASDIAAWLVRCREASLSEMSR